MSKKQDTRVKCDARRAADDPLNRRQFLGTGMAFGAGGLLAELGLTRYAQAQNATPPAGGALPRRRPPPGRRPCRRSPRSRSRRR